MLKKRLFEVEKKSEKKVKTATNFFQRSNLISVLKYEKKILDFFDRVQWTYLNIVPKATPKEFLSYV
jgi:hypothetical protein